MIVIYRFSRDELVELQHGDRIMLTCPAGMNRTVVYIFVDSYGKLVIEGGSSIISEIAGEGMLEKVRP